MSDIITTTQASNGYTVEINQYGASKVLDPTGKHVGGFSGPTRVWCRHSVRSEAGPSWQTEDRQTVNFNQIRDGLRLNVGSAYAQHVDAVVDACREATAS